MKRWLPLVVLCLILGIGWRVSRYQDRDISGGANQPKNTQQSGGFNKKLYSTDQPGSLWWIVNKNRPLPSGYRPDDLVTPNIALRGTSTNEEMMVRSVLKSDIERLFADAAGAGHNLLLASGFRSEAYQKQVYNNFVARDGQAATDLTSAKPGTSEHQTGMAIDVCNKENCQLESYFGTTNAGKWVAANAHAYGFIIRYQEGKTASTGYSYEPWHLRYVGQQLANELHGTNLTMEDFFGL